MHTPGFFLVCVLNSSWIWKRPSGVVALSALPVLSIPAGIQTEPFCAPSATLLVTLCNPIGTPALLQAAADMLTRVLELDSNNAFAWHTLGQMHEEQGRHAEALASYGSGCLCTGDCLLEPSPVHRCVLVRNPSTVLLKHAWRPHMLLPVRDHCRFCGPSDSQAQGSAIMHSGMPAPAPRGVFGNGMSVSHHLFTFTPLCSRFAGPGCPACISCALCRCPAQADTKFPAADKGCSGQPSSASLFVGSKAVLQNFQGLACMHAFLGQHDHARTIFEQGQQIYPQTSRFLRAFALFEKRQGRLQVGFWTAASHAISMASVPTCL